jgi:HEAT repeat protein
MVNGRGPVLESALTIGEGDCDWRRQGSTIVLEDLDQIAWDRLTHAYGEASDVPDLLRALASDDKSVRDHALHEFFGNIWHQGTVYEATAPTVPFLIELLREPSVGGKSEILFLLQSVASGSSYIDVHQKVVWYYDRQRMEEFRARRGRELGWVLAAHDAVVAGTPVYLCLLTHPEVAVRAMALYTLSVCRERAEEIELALKARLAEEHESSVKTNILLALAALGRSNRQEAISPVTDPGRLAYLATCFQNRLESAAVRFAAALAALELDTEESMSAAWPVLHESVAACRQVFSESPFIQDGCPLSAWSAALSNHPHLRLQCLLEALEHPEATLRIDAVWEIDQLCRERRSVPEAVVPQLALHVADPDSEVRKRVARTLPQLGRARHLAVAGLRAYAGHPDADVRTLAAQTLANVLKARRGSELAIRPPQPAGRDISELIATLQAKGNSPLWDDQTACSDAAGALEWLEPDAPAAVPALREALHNGSEWVRVRAARALWYITRDPKEVLPALLEELRCRPTGLLAADCLGDMGRTARDAIPALRRIIDSERRLIEGGLADTWIDEDEAFCEAAKQSLARIETDDGS